MASPQEHYQRASEAIASAEKSAKYLFIGLLCCTIAFILMLTTSKQLVCFGQWYMKSTLSTIMAFVAPLLVLLYIAKQNLNERK